MPKNVIECWLKCKNRYWIWFTRKCSLFGANECIFALLVAFSRKWMRIFSWWTAKGVMSKYYDKHNRLASACPLRNLSPVFGPSIEKNTNKRSDHLETRETAHLILFSAKSQIYKQNTYRKWWWKVFISI